MNYYKDKIDSTNKEISILSTKNNFFHTTRLLCFILMFLFLYLANNYSPILILLSFLSLISFIIIVNKHNKHEQLLNSYKNKVTVLKNYEYRINNQFHTFPNTGIKYLDENNFYLSDLDIFGDSSLFQLINVCETKLGQDLLAKRLKCCEDTYLTDVNSVSELKDKLDFSINFQSNMYNYSRDTSKISLESSLEELSKSPKLNIVDILIPIILILSTIVSCILTMVSKNITYFLAMIIINFTVSFVYSILRKSDFYSIKSIVNSLSPLAPNFKLVASEEFTNDKLNNIKTSISNGNEAMTNLQKIETLVSMQDNFISSLFVNSLIPFNFIVYIIYIRFHKKSNINIETSIKEYTYLETLLSLAIIPQIKHDVCIPSNNKALKVEFKDIKHPLIQENVCIANSLCTKPSVNIITGSNMSGKTSFLRTIGINLVLMYSGGMVNAKEFNSDCINIYSSMRITDDIKNGISTFYRELLRIKNAIKDAKEGVKSIIFVDEVFRGTNSNDRILGAISLINNLKLDNVILFMTTHDFELCKVQDVNNFHFEEHYTDDKIAFDYKLKDGRCTTTNAVYLMKLAGIIE